MPLLINTIIFCIVFILTYRLYRAESQIKQMKNIVKLLGPFVKFKVTPKNAVYLLINNRVVEVDGEYIQVIDIPSEIKKKGLFRTPYMNKNCDDGSPFISIISTGFYFTESISDYYDSRIIWGDLLSMEEACNEPDGFKKNSWFNK